MTAERRDDLLPTERLLVERLDEQSPVRSHPLSRSARQRERSLESHLAAAVLPRHIERMREIADELRVHDLRLECAYERIGDACGADDELFERRWRATVRGWRFDRVNELIRQHNEYYPIEARLPLDPRTCDYVLLRGRSYRREPVGPAWALERYPPLRAGAEPRRAVG
jgi:hypothetical protein